MPTDLLTLATERLEQLAGGEPKPVTEPTTLDAVLTRLFDPERQELETISAFGSAL